MMRRSVRNNSLPAGRSRQQGAALIIGLLLLLVLTLLAVSGMRSASEELIMAGNEQYRQDAFQGAEAGIEQAINTGIYDGATTNPVNGTVGTTPYTATITPQYGGATFTGVSGSSSDAAAGIFYEIASQGRSVRAAQVTTWQGVMQLVPNAGGATTANAGLGTGF
jgi:type IV pilus assembly protein PilX